MFRHRFLPPRWLPVALALLVAVALAYLGLAPPAPASPAAAPRTEAPSAETPNAALPDPGPADRCPVCGMPVAPYPEWWGRVLYADGTAVFFDGPKDLFRYLHRPGRYLPERAEDTARAVLVTAYYDGAVLPAEEALYVVGSDVTGPMGAELVPMRDRVEAEEFQSDHGGRGIVAYAEVTPELIAGLG